MARRAVISLIPDYSAIKKTEKDFMSRWYAACSFLRTEVESKVLKASSVKWLKKNRKFTADQFKQIESMEDWRFETLGKLCHVMLNGGEIPETGPAFITKTVEEFFVVASEKKETKEAVEIKEKGAVTERKGVQDYMREQAGSIASEFDGFIDDYIRGTADLAKFNPLAQMRAAQLKAGHARHITKYFQGPRDELLSVQDKNDDDLVEGYSTFSKKQIKDLLGIYEKILSSTSMLVTTSKATRKPRKKKALDLNKVIAKLKYRKEDTALGIASIRPIEIVGPKEIWVFSCKTRKVGRYITADPAGMGVKGSKITNFDEQKSLQKGLRKPKEQIKDFKKSTAKSLEVSFKAVKSIETKLTGRFNDDTVILKAYK